MKLSNVTQLSLSLLISGSILISSQQQGVSNVAQTEVPTVSSQKTRLPDWNQITFSKMPSIAKSGSFKVPKNVVDKLGYDPSRNWVKGQKPDSFTMLGDFQDSFQLQEFSLLDIFQITNLDLQQISLSDFGVIKFQTLDSLVKAIPDLKELTISRVKPIDDLLSQNFSSRNSLLRRINLNQNIGNLLKKSPHLGKLTFESLDLKSYKLEDIPGLSNTQIGSFDKWHSVYIDQVPGLKDVPFSQFPNPVNPVGIEVGRVDVAFGTNEQKRDRTISGSNKQGMSVPCDSDCAHVELSGSAAVKGKAWVSGKYQLVKGGKGVLGSVNSGKEPTGRHPFGSAFKVALWDVSEVDGMMNQSLFFRACMRNSFLDLGCTPYSIGPIPFMTYREKELIFLGKIDEDKNGVSTPTGLKSSGFTFNNSPIISKNNQKTISKSNFIPIKQGNCKNIHNSNTNLDALSNAYRDVADDYSFVGNYVCDSYGNCGRAIGAMKIMSYRPDVQKIITTKTGSGAFLDKLNAGENITGEEMMQYFSPREQQSLISSKTSNLLSIASQQTDPNTGKPFTGDRLIERVAQIHFAGVNIPIDSPASLLRYDKSLKDYGEKVKFKYSQNLQSMDCL